LSLAIGGYLIRRFRRAQVTEDVTQPDSQRLDEMRKCKRGTPTMGGFMIVGAVIIALLLFARVTDFCVLLACGAMLALAVLGFIDDYLKLRRGSAAVGRILKRKVKLAIEFVLGLGIAALILWHTQDRADLWGRLAVPFTSGGLYLGWAYGLVAALVIAGLTNAVNLTDGLDGLAGGCSVATALVLAVIASTSAGKGAFVSGAEELTVVCAALVGALLGFLWYNRHPARIFMGNIGALAVGGLLSVSVVLLRQEVLSLLFAAVFVIEAVSVALQVGYFKLTRKRIFLCAPFHHHLEFAGWPETKVTSRLWLLSAASGGLALILFRCG
jgi:phospho-N-acetylmuramoyl-pentapeptide-transferase